MKLLSLYSTVTNSRLSERVSLAIREFITGCEGEWVRVEITRGRKRSIEQNKYLHAAITILREGLNELGNDFTMQEVKDIVKAKFLKVDVYSADGELIGERVKSTTELSTAEMVSFIDSFRQWSQDTFGIYIPNPNEAIQMDI